MFNLRSPIPKYRSFWKVQEVLATQYPLIELNLEMLTSKTTALTSAQRSLSLMDVNYMNITEIFISSNIQHFQKISNFGNLSSVIKNRCFS